MSKAFIQIIIPVLIWIVVYLIATKLKKGWAVLLAWIVGLNTGIWVGTWIANSQ